MTVWLIIGIPNCSLPLTVNLVRCFDFVFSIHIYIEGDILMRIYILSTFISTYAFMNIFTYVNLRLFSPILTYLRGNIKSWL